MSLKTRIFNPSSQPINITSNNINNYNNLTISGDTIINKELLVNGDTTIKNKLNVYNDTSFNKNVEISGQLIVNGNISSNNIFYLESYINQFKLLSENNSNFKFVNNSNQTFYDIITQQPLRFTSVSEYSSAYNSSPKIITSRKINIEWNYDDILAYNNFTELAELNFLTDLKEKQLPYIDYIVVQIQGIINSTKTEWIDCSKINIPKNTIYNQDLYKNFILYKFVEKNNLDNSLNKILSTNDKFNVRVFGMNNSNLYPSIDLRSLYFNDVNFFIASSPSVPILNTNGEKIENNNTIILNYYTNRVEEDNINSDALITNYIITYFPLESLRSNIYEISTNILDIYELSSNNLNKLGIFSPGYVINQKYVEPLSSIYTNILNINNITDTGYYIKGYSKDISFNIIMYNLISGTKYNYKTKIKNDLSDLYSQETSMKTSNYTMIPDSNYIDISLNLNISNNKTFISQLNDLDNSFIDNKDIIYINLSDNQSIIPDIIDYQTIEISHPYIYNQQDLSYGFGKYIENKNNLVSLIVYINDISKQEIIFDGSFSMQSGRIINYDSNLYNFIELKYIDSLDDIYKDNSLNKGFRLKGTLKLNTLNNNLINDIIGDASSNPYKLTYKYIRHQDVSNKDISKDYLIYIDDISYIPRISNIINTSNVKNVLYNMGIPSVQYFDLNFSRDYNNINSKFNYLAGNKVISIINSINNTNCDISTNIKINIDEINKQGYYTYNDLSFKTNNYYKNISYTNNLTTLTWKENVINLYKLNQYDISYITNHFIDYNSFIKNNNIIDSNILDLSLIDVYYINNIDKIGSDILDISLIKYVDHKEELNESTLMFINGFFQSNKDYLYPNIDDYSYNNIIINNNYNKRNISYDIDGNINNLNGYKWIVIKLKKLNDNYYIFNDNNNKFIDIKISNNGYKYISLNDVNNFNQNYNLFKEKSIEDLVNNSNLDVIGFVTTKYINYYNIPFSLDDKIGNLKKLFSPFSKWIEYGNLYKNMKLSNLIYNTTESSSRYGCLVYNNILNEYGIFIDPNRIIEDLYIYIGIKNQ